MVPEDLIKNVHVISDIKGISLLVTTRVWCNCISQFKKNYESLNFNSYCSERLPNLTRPNF